MLIVSDMVRFRIRTNGTNSVGRKHEFELDDLPTRRRVTAGVWKEKSAPRRAESPCQNGAAGVGAVPDYPEAVDRPEACVHRSSGGVRDNPRPNWARNWVRPYLADAVREELPGPGDTGGASVPKPMYQHGCVRARSYRTSNHWCGSHTKVPTNNSTNPLLPPSRRPTEWSQGAQSLWRTPRSFRHMRVDHDYIDYVTNRLGNGPRRCVARLVAQRWSSTSAPEPVRTSHPIGIWSPSSPR